jgi:hypothetical protein
MSRTRGDDYQSGQVDVSPCGTVRTSSEGEFGRYAWGRADVSPCANRLTTV